MTNVKTIASSWARWMFVFGSLALVTGNPLYAQENEDEDEEEDEEEIEQIIVTGSVIRRDNFDLPSPMNVLDRVDFDLAGTTDMGEIIFDQPWQVGVNSNATPFEGDGADDQQWNQGNEVWANIRGLGTRATMTMMDGHRLPADTNTWGRRSGVDVTNTYPGIAIGRQETILDGASALYGSEAVSGVINQIPRKDFDGLTISMDLSSPLDNGAPTRGISLLAGAQGERTRAIFAMEVRDIEQMRYTDRPRYITSTKDKWTSQNFTVWWHDAGDRGTPGDFAVPVRGVNGELYPAGDNWQRGLDHPYRYDWGTADFVNWVPPVQYGRFGDRELADAQGRHVAAFRMDPGCGYGFGAGHDDLGTSDPNMAGQAELTYNDLNKHGNFLNGVRDPRTDFIAPNNGNTFDISDYVGGGGVLSIPDDPGQINCRMSVSDMQDLQADTDREKAMAYFEHDFNDYVSVRGEFVASRLDYFTRDVTGGLDELFEEGGVHPLLPYVVGSNPGNPYRAYADGSWVVNGQLVDRPSSVPNVLAYLDYMDVNGNGRYDYLDEPGEAFVFAQDWNGDGIPDRSPNGADFNGDGIPDANVAYQHDPAARVILLTMMDSDGDGLPDRFDPDAGGLHLYEDVRMTTSSGGQLNVNPKQPRNNNIEWLDDDGILTYRRRAQRDNLRLRLGTTINVPNTTWDIDADWIWATGKRVRQYPEPVWDATVKALRCQGGPEGDSCWNPFSTAWLMTDEYGQFLGDPTNKFPDENDPGWRPPDAKEVNTEVENRQAGLILQYNRQDLSMSVIDLIASNASLFNLWYNDSPVGLAIGSHWRLEGEEWNPNASNQTAFGGGNNGLRKSEQETRAVFVEVALPLIQSPTFGEMEVQLAARYAEIESRGLIGQQGSAKFDTTIPKVAVRYQPLDWLALRGSYTKGFVTPGLYALFGEPQTTTQRGTVSDYLCNTLPELDDCGGQTRGQAGFTGAIPNVIVGASPSSVLGAEVSDLYNLGFNLKFLDGDLTVAIDWTTVDFNGRAERLGTSGHVGINAVGFEDFLLESCPGTTPDWDNPTRWVPEEFPNEFANTSLSLSAYRELVGPDEIACRRQAALNWVATVANDGQGERSLGSARLQRGGGVDGLRLTLVEDPWLAQGEQTTETVIYQTRYQFDAQDIPFVGGDYGVFEARLNATNILEMSMERYTLDSGHPLGGIRVDGVGNRNQTAFAGAGGLSGDEGLFAPLAPTPEWRIAAGLRWFYDRHAVSLDVNWHDSITSVHAGWDELREAGLLNDNDAAILESERCQNDMINPYCGIDSRHYWNMTYSYTHYDWMGFESVNITFAVRNIFDTYPDAFNDSAGHDGYLDNIMGRIGFMNVNFNL